MAVAALPGQLGWKAQDFRLPDPDGQPYTLADIQGSHGTVVMFICNHCPAVRAIVDSLAADIRELQARGIGAIAIMPNDYAQYPEDAPARMKEFAARHGFTFPYVIDETQAVARAYDAVCTPDFFGFDRDLTLQYHGRLDNSRVAGAGPRRRELIEAMAMIAETSRGPDLQHASIGCSIKWRTDA